MAIKTILGIGNTLDFLIPLPQSILELHNVTVKLFTNEDRPVKFSYLEIPGQNRLILGETNFLLKGKLLSKHTAKMQGCLFMRVEIIADEIEATENVGNSIKTDTTIIFE